MTTVRIGVSEKNGTFWNQAESIVPHVIGAGRLSCELVEAGQASIDNARRLDQGRIDLGFMASNWVGRARSGKCPFSHPIDLRVAAPANVGSMFFVTRADSSLRRVRDMVGKRVSIGVEGSGMVQHIHTLFGVLGIGFDEFEPVYLSFADGGRALEAGDVDAQWQCPYPNPVMRDISNRFDVRVLEYDEGEIEEILNRVAFYRRGVLLPGVFRGVRAASAQVAVVNIIAAHARTDEGMVGEWVKAILDNLDALAAANPLFDGLGRLFQPLRDKGAAALEFGDVPLHAGALRAYREAGYLD